MTPFRRTALCAIALAAASARCQPPPRRPSVLLITIDTLRADHVSAYGYGVRTTPRLDRLASEGVLFEQAYAGSTVTGPSHATLLTSQPARAHGVVRNGYRLPPGTETLASILKAHGWSTAAIVSAYPLDRRFGFASGFDTYDDVFLAADSSAPGAHWEGRALDEPYDRRADATTRRAAAWMEKRVPGAPFFLWVHYFDPHSPYDAPVAWRLPGAGGDDGRHAAYDAEIRFADHEVGKLLDVLEAGGQARDTLVVVTSDHGEGLGDHGELEHGPLVYEEAVRVPLVARFPNRLPAGVRRRGLVELLDVAPTVLELLGLRPQPSFRGRSLVPLAHGKNGDVRRAVIVQSEYDEAADETVFGVRRGDTKYIETRTGGATRRRELYDLLADAEEVNDRSVNHAPLADALATTLSGWRHAIGPARASRIDPADAERLRALGYAR